MDRARMAAVLVSFYVIVLMAPFAGAQQIPLWRVDAGGAIEFRGGATGAPSKPDLQGAAAAVDGVYRFVADGGKVTFAANRGFGIDDHDSFTLSLEIRTTRGAFATPLMCREGSSVHYSFVVGRHEGTIAFEPWCWSRARAESTTRIDDGVWHRIIGIYDASQQTITLLCDGKLEAEVSTGGGFAGSSAPALRLGDNLDPNVRQAFVGELRGVELSRGVPTGLVEQRERFAALRVFPGDAVASMLSTWNDRHRERRPPAARDLEDWKAQARRTRVLVQDACGLWPPPYSGAQLAGRASPGVSDESFAPTAFPGFHPDLDLDLREGGKIERPEWSVTRVYWQSFAGYYASGWLYRPVGEVADHARAAVLCPHGHWSGGATHPVVQKRCITLARAGYVVLAVDSLHVEDTRIALSPLSAMTWNNLRGLELLRAQRDVDPARIGCTGASGGGQQTYYLAALDTGLAAAVPAVMACHFHEILGTDGPHCHCNHTPFLAEWTDMPIMGACFAPTPQLFLTVTGDWTHEFPQRGFPEIATVYGLFGARDSVSVMQWDKGHDYDRPMRNAMYAFFARHLLGETEPDSEFEKEEAPAEEPSALIALDRADIPRDTGAIAAEFFTRLMRPVPTAGDVMRDGFADTLRARFRTLFVHGEAGADAPAARRVAVAKDTSNHEKWVVPADGAVQLPVLLGRSTAGAPRCCVVLVHPDGKAVALATHAELVTRLRAGGCTVIAVDLRYTGELDGGRNWRDLHGRFYGFDEGQLAVEDLRRVASQCKTMAGDVPVIVVADQWLGAAALFASTLDEQTVAVIAPDLGRDYADAPRRPQLARILLHGDLPDAALATRAHALLVGGSGNTELWKLIDGALGDRIRRTRAPIDDSAIAAFVESHSRPH